MIEKFDIAGYCRISVDEEMDRDNTSIENQKAIIKDYVLRQFPGSSLTFYEDRDRSGYTFEQREGYQEMRPFLMGHKYDILVVKDFSRFSRRNSRGLCELEDLRDAGVRIISIGDSIDYPTYDDWTAIQFRFLVNEMPVTDTSKKVRYVVKKRQSDGEWICASPYGYITTGNKSEPFKIMDDEAEVIRKIYDLYIEGWGYQKIAKYLTEQNIPTPRMNEKMRKEQNGAETKIKARNRWSIVTVQGILTNDFYIGTLRQGKFTRKKINGADIKKDVDDQIVFEKHHEAIIDDRTFAIAQAAYCKRSVSNYRGVKKYANVYSGLMICGDCGSPMFPMSRGQIKDAYRCGNYHQNGLKGCTSHHIRTDVLDEMVKTYLRNVRDTSAEMIVKLQKDLENESDAMKNNKQTIDILNTQLADSKEEKKMLVRQQTRELMRNPDREDSINDTYDELIAECEERILGLENQIALTADKQNTIVRVNRVAKQAIDIFGEILDKDSLDKNDLELIVEQIIVYEDHIHIKLKSDIECILRSGTLPKGQVVNFSSGIIDILSRQLVQASKNRPDKVYDVNVISNGDPLEIYTGAGGEVVFRKYSPVGELGAISDQYAEAVATSSKLGIVITDRDRCISAAGISKREVIDRELSPELDEIMKSREIYIYSDDKNRLPLTNGDAPTVLAAYPIISSGDLCGSVVLVPTASQDFADGADLSLASVAAIFLGKQLED